MANFSITEGSGTVMAAVDNSSVLHQQVVMEFDVSGTATKVSSTAPLPTTLTNLEKEEDAAHSTGDKGIMGLAVRNDALASLCGADGDYTPLQVDAEGALYVNVNGASANIVDTYTASVTATGSTDAGANRIHQLVVSNGDGSNAHTLKIYDKATAADENDTPVAKVRVAANGTETVVFSRPLEIANGISMRATTEHADSGTTGATANDVAVTLFLDA